MAEEYFTISLNIVKMKLGIKQSIESTHIDDRNHDLSDEIYEPKLCKALHQDKQGSKEKKRPPFHFVKYSFHFLDISKYEQHNCSQNRYPPCTYTAIHVQ